MADYLRVSRKAKLVLDTDKFGRLWFVVLKLLNDRYLERNDRLNHSDVEFISFYGTEERHNTHFHVFHVKYNGTEWDKYVRNYFIRITYSSLLDNKVSYPEMVRLYCAFRDTPERNCWDPQYKPYKH